MTFAYLVEDCEAMPGDSIYNHAALSGELKMFAARVRKLFPRAKFSIYVRHGYNNLLVYHPNKPLCMGWIGFGDYTNSDTASGYKYVVFSENIANYQYASHSWQRHLMSSGNLNQAVKNVSRHLRDYSVENVAKSLSREARSEWHKEENDSKNEISSAFNALRYDDDLRDELIRLHAAGHMFITEKLQRKVDELAAAHDTERDASKYRLNRVSMVCVTSTLRGEQVFEVCTVPNILGFDSHGNKFIAEQTYTENELPEDLRDKLGVLNITEEKQFVPGVGYKLTDGILFVARGEVAQ